MSTFEERCHDERPYIVAFVDGFDAYDEYSDAPPWERPPANPHAEGTDAHQGWQAGWDEAREQHEQEMDG